MSGLAATFGVLARTDNEAAVSLLIAALDSPRAALQEASLGAILDRRSPAGQREILRRLPAQGDRWRPTIDARRGRMATALRDAVLGSDPQLCASACQAILWFHEYDLMTALLTAAEDETNPNSKLALDTLVELARLLYDELAQPRDYRNRRDPQTLRRNAVGALEAAVARYGKHRRREIVESFLLLVYRDNATLQQILHDAHHVASVPVADLLATSEQGGVVRLLLSLLEDPHAPHVALTSLARRSDPKFVEHLLRKIGSEPSKTIALNLKRIEQFAWLHGGHDVVDQLDGLGQYAVVQLAVHSGMKRREAFELVRHLLAAGKAEGRRAAVQALAEFTGADANALVVRALDDEDPLVQAGAAAQLRSRGIQGALGRLIELLDSPHAAVAQAARDSLAEFNARRFLASFDMLDEEARRTTGALVKKIDPRTVPLIKEELSVHSRTRRLRALRMAVVVGVAPWVETEVIVLLGDEDHVVRSEAAAALGACRSPTATAAVQSALGDRSQIVREAAAGALEQMQRPMADEEPASAGPGGRA